MWVKFKSPTCSFTVLAFRTTSSGSSWLYISNSHLTRVCSAICTRLLANEHSEMVRNSFSRGATSGIQAFNLVCGDAEWWMQQRIPNIKLAVNVHRLTSLIRPFLRTQWLPASKLGQQSGMTWSQSADIVPQNPHVPWCKDKHVTSCHYVLYSPINYLTIRRNLDFSIERKRFAI